MIGCCGSSDIEIAGLVAVRQEKRNRTKKRFIHPSNDWLISKCLFTMQVKGTCTVESKKVGVLKDTCKIKRTRNRTETMNEGNIVVS